jgi:nucleoside-diphosphate kinase
MQIQRTLVIFKPDCVQRRLVGQVLQRFEAKGLRLAAMKLMQVDHALAERHYAEHRERSFFKTLIEFITGGPVVVAVLSGPEAVAVVRTMMGKTDATEAHPGTIRGDFAISKQNNLIHGSDGPDTAEREIALWFRPEELLDYDLVDSRWVTGS